MTSALKIKVVATGGSIRPSTQADAVTVTSASGVVPAATTRLDSLVDVVEGTPTNNSTLVYYSANDTYVVEQLNLDGGSF